MTAVTAIGIARVAYEARRAYALALGEPVPPEWEEAPPGVQSEAIAGAEAVLSGEARSGAHLHDALSRRVEPGYDQLGLDQRRKVLLFRAVVLALIDGPCNGFCHDEHCPILEDHDCHLDTCMSKFGVPPGLWSPSASTTGYC